MDSGESNWDQNAENCQSESDKARAGSLLAKGNTSEQLLLPGGVCIFCRNVLLIQLLKVLMTLYK